MPAVLEFVGLYDRKVQKPKTFIRDNFFKNEKTHELQKFEIEFRKGRELVAPYVSEFIPGTEMIKNTYESKFYKAPKVAPMRTFTAHELFFEKLAGETIYGGKSPDERRAELLANSLRDFEEQITRREEIMCIEALFNGKVLVEGEGVKDEITYGTINTITPTTLWSNLAGADIIADLSAAINDIGEKTGLRPEMIVVDPVAASYIMNNEKLKNLLDLRNYNIGELAPKDLPSGAMYVGTLAPFGLPIYSYQNQVSTLNADGKTLTTKKLIPEGTVLLAPSNNVMHYGAAADVEKGIIVGKRTVFQDQDSKSNTVEIRTESRPLPVIYDLDAIRILKVK